MRLQPVFIPPVLLFTVLLLDFVLGIFIF